MRPLVALVLVAIAAYAVGVLIVHAFGEHTALVAGVMFGTVAVGSAGVWINDALERRADRHRPPVVQLSELPRRIRQGRP